MDWGVMIQRITEYTKKYRFVLLVVFVGVFLMAMPERSETEEPKVDVPKEAAELSLERKLEDILSKIDGAGTVNVLLSQAAGEEILYQTDENLSTGTSEKDIRTDTVLITDQNRVQSGLVRQVNPPVYQGAVILCQGAEKAGVRLSIVEAVMDITGLSSDKITVLKMK